MDMVGVLPSFTKFSDVRNYVSIDITMDFPYFKTFLTCKPKALNLEDIRELKSISSGLDVSEFMYLDQWFQIAYAMPLRHRDTANLMDMIALTYSQILTIISNLHDSFDVLKRLEMEYSPCQLKQYREGHSLNSNMVEVMLSLEHLLLEEGYLPEFKTDLVRQCKATAIHHRMFHLGCPPVTFQSGLFSRYFYMLGRKDDGRDRKVVVKQEN